MENFIIGLIATVLGQMSPSIREAMVTWVDDMAVKAAETPNPWDDIFVSFLRILLGVKANADTGD